MYTPLNRLYDQEVSSMDMTGYRCRSWILTAEACTADSCRWMQSCRVATATI